MIIASYRRAVFGAASLTALSLALAAPAHAATTADDAVSAAQTGSGQSGEILVTGDKSDSERDALNAKRKALGVVDIMSRDEIAAHPAGTIVDAITHLPGLSGFADMGLGQAATGEQEYVSIRGIDSSYNAYTLNGVRVPQADPQTRALSLKMLPPNGIQSVTVSKTPSVDMDGDSIGGVIDIRTPTAFDFQGPVNSVTVQGHIAQLASKTGSDWGGVGGSAEFARRFGSDGQFGFYATGYYDKKSTAAETVEATGYAPDLASEATATNYRTVSGLTPTGVRYDYYNDDIKRYGGNASLDYRGDTNSFYLQGSYSRYGVQGTDTQHSILNGQTSLYSNGTTYSPEGIMPGGYFQLRDQTEQLITVKAGGTSDFGRLHLSYSGSYGRSTQARPDYVEGSLYGTVDTTGYASGINLSDPAHTVVTYDSAATKNYVLNEDTDRLWKFQGSDSGSSANTYTGRIDAHYDIHRGLLDNVSAGFKYSSTDRYQYQHEFFGNDGDNFVILDSSGEVRPFSNPAGPATSALPGHNLTSFLGGFPGVFRILDRSTFEKDVLPYIYTSQYGLDANGNVVGNPGAYTINDYNRNTVSGNETIYAGYASTKLGTGPLDVVAGLRYEYTDFSSSQWVVDGDTGYFQSSGNHYGEWLPSLIATYRPDKNMVIRGAIRRSYSRPAFGLIASPITYSFNDVTGAVDGISEGNPNLKPSTATNYDLSAEWYGAHDTLIEANAYYKSINDFIYAATSSGALPSASTATINNSGVDITSPENGKHADLYGISLDARHYFRGLPGVLGGFGLAGSATFQHSSADSGRADHYGRKTWLPRAPQTIYNVDLLYDAHGIHADLSYQYQGLQLVGLTSNNLDEYLQPTKSLDFSISYPVRNIVFTASAKNLTNNIMFYKTLGKTTRYLGTQDGGGDGSYVATGRFFNISATMKF